MCTIKELHIKSPDGRFCTRILGFVKNKEIHIIKLLGVSLGCNQKENKND